MTDSIKVKFFARLREELNVSDITVPASDAQDLAALKRWLIQRHPDWQLYLEKPLLTAVNQTMTRRNQTLEPGDEVAFFPPVTGG